MTGNRQTVSWGIGRAAIVVGALCGQAQAEQDCAETVRSLIRGEQTLNTPVASQSTTKMAGGLTMVSRGLSDGKTHLTMDADGKPVSLFTEDRFYTTPDGGDSWTLVQTYTPETLAESRTGLAEQADKASNITCAYGIDLDGRTVNHYTADYAIHTTGTPIHGEFWVDAQTGFAWKSLMVSDPGGNEIVIEQRSEPAPGASVPDPDR